MDVAENNEPTGEIRRGIAEIAAIAAGAAMQHGLGKDMVSLDEAILNRRDSIGKEVAEVAVKKGLVKPEDISQVPLSVVNEIAILAASSAIQKGTTENDSLPLTRVQEARSLATKAAEAAIQKKLVPDERNDLTLADLAEISRYAASAAVQKGLPVEDQNLKDEDHEHQRQGLAQLAAGAALQRGLASDKVDDETAVKNKEMASLAAGSAIQHGFATERPNQESLHTLSSLSRSAAEAALKKSTSNRPVGVVSEDEISEQYLKAAREAAQFAIDHKLIDRPEPPFELVSEVARLAAGSAIQRGLSDEVLNERSITERKEVLAEVARNAASFAIQRGLGAEVKPDRRLGYELAVLAASAAIRRQEQDQQTRVDPQQMAQVAQQAAQEAVRLGYGHDESELINMPKTPPVSEKVSTEQEVTKRTDLVDKEQTQKENLVYRESEVEEIIQPSFCFCFAKCFKST